jgi:hypothetical protein
VKFLCLVCDAQMKTVETERQPQHATLSIVLECPECFGRVGMMTNPMETRMLDALDVSVCPVGGKGRKPAAAVGSGLRWSADAEERLARVPSFVRDVVRQRIEDAARERGSPEVTSEVMDAVREQLGM